MRKCGLETETTLHLLQILFYHKNRDPERYIYTAVSSVTIDPDEKNLNILLYGSEDFSVKTKQSILKVLMTHYFCNRKLRTLNYQYCASN